MNKHVIRPAQKSPRAHFGHRLRDTRSLEQRGTEAEPHRRQRTTARQKLEHLVDTVDLGAIRAGDGTEPRHHLRIGFITEGALHGPAVLRLFHDAVGIQKRQRMGAVMDGIRNMGGKHRQGQQRRNPRALALLRHAAFRVRRPQNGFLRIQDVKIGVSLCRLAEPFVKLQRIIAATHSDGFTISGNYREGLGFNPFQRDAVHLLIGGVDYRVQLVEQVPYTLNKTPFSAGHPASDQLQILCIPVVAALERRKVSVIAHIQGHGQHTLHCPLAAKFPFDIGQHTDTINREGLVHTPARNRFKQCPERRSEAAEKLLFL